jgi:hypothetical protein
MPNTSTTTTPRRHWVGTPPARCDLCHRPIEKTFIDGKTQFGPWANMCVSCHRSGGCGLGTGRGQKYTRDPADGVWYKVGG